ncbi:MAG: hypothetical protein ACTSYO_10265 [Candidatus Ranarchaeia archaeon]
MSSLKVYIDDKIAKAFRKTAMQIFGYGKGSLSKAAEAAFKEWIREHSTKTQDLEIPEHPIDAIANQLKDIPQSSVTLQHKVKQIRASQALDS